MSTVEVLDRLRRGRAEFAALARALTDAQLDRVGHHPLFGALTLRRWVEFFPIHEAHPCTSRSSARGKGGDG
jgi:hypothetical protein